VKVDFSRVMGLMALRFAGREAVVNTERGRRYDFDEYHRLTNRIANVLRLRLGLGAGDAFMPIIENDNLALLHFPMFFKQAATAAFTNYRDSMEEHFRQIDFLGPKVVFLELPLLGAYAAPLRERGITIVAMDTPPAGADVHSFWELVAAAPDSLPGVELDVNEHTVLFRFTGGTTGRPKCAGYSMDNLFATRDGFYVEPDCGYSSKTRNLHLAPLSHGSLMTFLASFFVGGCNLTMNTVDLPRFLDLVEQERVTHSFMVPTILYRLLDLQREKPRNLASLQTIIYGAAPMSPTKLRELVECMGNVFVQGYASTEAIMAVSLLNKDDHMAALAGNMEHLASAGRMAPGIEVVITDPDGKAVPVGTTGEIRIRSRATIRCYHNNPEATAAEFADGFWKSGDLGVLDADGYLTIVDRTKDMIITGGFNVYAVEVEGAVNAHPAVSMCAVVGVPHDEWGEAVHAEVVLRDGMQASEEEIVAYVKARLGAYKSPKSVRFVESLPLSAVGKVLRRTVRAPYWAGRERMVH
jgi:acyl-CoA synthetase (AMP-forming)/AMP-acid ligase II